MRKRTLFLAAVLAAVSLFTTLGPLRAQAPARPSPQATPAPGTPSFPAQVEVVTVDVVVTDKKGSLVPGLTKDAFTVLEDGQPQTIATFEAIRLPDQPAEVPPPPPPVSSNVGPEARVGRSFVVVFDDVHLTPFQAHRAKAAVGEFLKTGVREGDRVTLVATGGGAWWTSRMESGREELMALLKRLDGRYIPDNSPDRMSDYEAMRIHVYNDQQVADRVARRYETYGVNPGAQSRAQSDPSNRGLEGDPMVRSRATDVYFQSVNRNRVTLEILERSLNALAGTKGRKSLILVSEGFIYDPNLDEFKRVVQASRRSNVAIYFLDTRGLGDIPIYMTAQFGPALPEQDIGFAFMESIEASEGSESIAADSGGFTVKNTNDLGKGIKKIAEESRVYYLLGYNPTNTAKDGRYRKIQVKLAKGYEVRARRGYYAPLEGKGPFDRKPGGPDPLIQTALDSPFDVPEIPLRMTSYVFDETLLGKASVMVTTEVDIRDFAFEEKEGRAVDTLEFLLVVAHRETGEFFRYDQKVDMKLLPATRDRFRAAWFPLVRDFELAPGGYQGKIVVRDQNSGRIGTVVHQFEVPELTRFRTSTPVITDTLQQGKEEERPRPVMLARRSFASGATLYCSFDVYGAAKDKNGMPRVSAGYEIRRTDGTLFSSVARSEIRPTSLGKLSRMIGTRLEAAEPGEYELILDFKDEVAGKTLQVTEPFTVVAASPS